MKSPIRCAGRLAGSVSLLLLSSAAWPAELYVSTFLGTNPLKDLEIELDGRMLGSTDHRGGIVAQLEGGTHLLRVLEQGAEISQYRFELAPNENADVAITYSDFETAPEVSFDKYDPSAPEQGAPGVIQGQITDAEGNPLAGATARIEPSGAEVQSDAEGLFRIEAPRGQYTLSVSAEGYQDAQASGLRVAPDVGIAIDVALERPGTQDATEIGGASDGPEEIVVVSSYNARKATTANIKRFSSAVTDAISVEDLVRAGDSDVAASLKRVVGVSISGGRYAIVRGLDGRYIASTLNGNLLPSTDPFRRDVQLDLFPTDILGGIEVQKSFTADMPGDTTGGIIKIGTREIPNEYINSLSLSGGYVTGITGDKLLSYHGGGMDWLGYDDGERDLPGALDSASNGGLGLNICQVSGQSGCVSQSEAARLAGLLPNHYNTESRKAAPQLGLSYALGNSFSTDAGRLGVYGVATYDSSATSRQNARVDNISTLSTYARDAFKTATSGYVVAGYESDSGWTINSKTLYLHDSEDTTVFEQGFDKIEENNFSRVMLEWVERQLVSEQLSGTWKLFDTHKLEWRTALSQTTRLSPDRRAYSYLGNSLVVSSVERSYSDLTEDAIDFGIDYSLPFSFGDSVSTSTKFGVMYNKRDRTNELVRIGVRAGSQSADLSQDIETLLSEQAFQDDEFRLRGSSTVTDTYDGEQESIAGYVTTQIDLGTAWTIYAGVRQDNFEQNLDFPNSPGTTADLKSDELLPSLSALYRLGDDLQFRLGYARTVSRPNITELAPSRFYDDLGREYIGCPTCVASNIDNFDARVEYYFDRNDSVSFAVFHKNITDPLERSVADGSGSATNALTFRNNEKATISGAEVDGNRSFLLSDDHMLSLGANLSVFDSKITLDDVGQRLELSDNRKLQGQSPFLANLRLGYDHFPTKQKATLTANYFDDRINIVTRAPQEPIYEAGRIAVNLTYEKEFVNLSKLSFRIQNLLDAKTRFVQDGKTIESWKSGVEFTLGYNHRF